MTALNDELGAAAGRVSIAYGLRSPDDVAGVIDRMRPGLDGPSILRSGLSCATGAS